MQYMVIPFVARIQTGQGAEVAAQQLQELINEQIAGGWRYVRLENIEIIIHDPGRPGKSGCFGIGAEPSISPSQEIRRYDMVVFEKNG